MLNGNRLIGYMFSWDLGNMMWISSRHSSMVNMLNSMCSSRFSGRRSRLSSRYRLSDSMTMLNFSSSLLSGVLGMLSSDMFSMFSMSNYRSSFSSNMLSSFSSSDMLNNRLRCRRNRSMFHTMDSFSMFSMFSDR
jgi:hypothetical protein